MFQDYKLAYSDKGDAHTEEAESTVTVGWLLLKRIFRSEYQTAEA
jgi:hypothetical protein